VFGKAAQRAGGSSSDDGGGGTNPKRRPTPDAFEGVTGAGDIPGSGMEDDLNTGRRKRSNGKRS
jgi:hypothetical protein